MTINFFTPIDFGEYAPDSVFGKAVQSANSYLHFGQRVAVIKAFGEGGERLVGLEEPREEPDWIGIAVRIALFFTGIVPLFVIFVKLIDVCVNTTRLQVQPEEESADSENEAVEGAALVEAGLGDVDQEEGGAAPWHAQLAPPIALRVAPEEADEGEVIVADYRVTVENYQHKGSCQITFSNGTQKRFTWNHGFVINFGLDWFGEVATPAIMVDFLQRAVKKGVLKLNSQSDIDIYDLFNALQAKEHPEISQAKELRRKIDLLKRNWDYTFSYGRGDNYGGYENPFGGPHSAKAVAERNRVLRDLRALGADDVAADLENR